MSKPRFWPHLLRVEVSSEPAMLLDIAPLVAAAAGQGMRVGWLELGPGTSPVPERPVPERLDHAAGAGALRAVAVGGGRTVVVKPMRGEPVLRDVLREHFRGCALVLVVELGADAPAASSVGDAPCLTRLGDGQYRVADADREVCVDTAELIERLRRPRPW